MAGTLNLETLNFKKNAYITIEGNNSKSLFYIIGSGKVKLRRSVDLANISDTDNLLVEGDYFGLVESMSGHKIMDTVEAFTDVKLVIVKKSQFNDFATRHPTAVQRFLKHFSKKLTFFNDLISKQTGESSQQDDKQAILNIEKIYDTGEYYYNNKQYNLALYCYVKYIKYISENEEIEGKNVKEAKQKISKISNVAKDAMNPQNKDSGIIRTYKDGTMLCCDNEPGEEVFVIQKGQVRITKVVDNREQVFAVLDEGTPVGEMSLLLGASRSANIIAKGDTQVLVVNKNNFDMMVKSQPEMAKKLLENFADRIWKSYRQLANMLLEDPIARLWDQLLLEVETKKIDTSSRNPYTFDFGPKDLLKMVGLDPNESKSYIKEMVSSKKVEVEGDKIKINSLKELEDEAKFYKGKLERDRKMKMEKLKRGNI